MFLSAWFAPYQKLSFSALAFGGLARAALRSSITMESEGVSAFCALLSPCIVATFRSVDSTAVPTRESMTITS
jgi:hypothetical protein